MAKEEVKDGYLGDLPEEIRVKIMNIHKMIKEAINTEFKRKKYDSIRNQQWAKTMIDEFLTAPSDKNHVGSVRLYKRGNRYRCMIQITGHVTNNRNTEDEELFHGFIRNTHTGLRAKIRRKFDVTIECESEHGEPFEGYDVWTKPKVAKELWKLFADKTTKPFKESVEDLFDHTSMYCEMEELPIGLQTLITETAEHFGYKDVDSYCELVNINESYNGTIFIDNNESVEIDDMYEEYVDIFEEDNPGKFLNLNEGSLSINLDPEYVKKLWNYLESVTELNEEVMTEAKNTPEYNVDMTEAQAKKTLRTLSQGIINDVNDKKDYKVTQYTANIYANIITKNLLPLWASGYRKLSITLDSYQSFHTLEFRIPSLTQDFISRFIEGRESINGFLHRNPEIKIKMSPRIFHTMKNPDDAFNFFKAAIKYYDSGVTRYSERIMSEAMKLNREMKHLVSTTKLSGIVSAPIKFLFVFDDVDMSDKNTFKISTEDINTVNKFIKGIYTNYAAPDKEKKKILNDLDEVVKSLRESCEDIGDIKFLPEYVEKWYNNEFDTSEVERNFVESNIDRAWPKNAADRSVIPLSEKFGVKKLKKIPRDLVAYISIEAECIKDANDKMMIASYCLSKLEIVEWYIELIDSNSQKYIVPHTRAYLESIRTQLLACYKKIMNTKITNPNDRPLIDIKYPLNYEG